MNRAAIRMSRVLADTFDGADTFRREDRLRLKVASNYGSEW